MREPGVQWRDLVALTRREVAMELCLPLPWLLAATMAGAAGHRGWVVFATLIMFMMGLRITHNAFHRNLGISRSAGDLVMFALSVLLGGAMHAIEYTHLRHHRNCLADDDVEGHIAHLGFLSAVLHSPIYPMQIHWVAMRRGSNRQKRWIVLELTAVVLLHAAIWLSDNSTLKVMAMSLYFANASAPLVGIWAVHRNCEKGRFRARTSRSILLNALTVNLFNHLEHHLYPAVPTCHLPILARRLDAHWQGDEPPPDVLGCTAIRHLRAAAWP
ncbi:fatty acid desaturase [Dokdonella sp.]|uniref:fatty acid desaturase family protein n=1 Tax=Dokdonella sp. TaxID=2291710 RepID=UPI00352868F1